MLVQEQSYLSSSLHTIRIDKGLRPMENRGE